MQDARPRGDAPCVALGDYRMCPKFGGMVTGQSGAILADSRGVPDSEKTNPIELVSAGIFVLGCMGLCAMLIWLGADGFAPGFALYALGWIVAMEVEDRYRHRWKRRRLLKARPVGSGK